MHCAVVIESRVYSPCYELFSLVIKNSSLHLWQS